MTLSSIVDKDIEVVFYALDDNGDRLQINREEFADLCNAISLKFERVDKVNCTHICIWMASLVLIALATQMPPSYIQASIASFYPKSTII